MKDKTTAGILGIFLGGLGVHKFYLGETGTGVLYILFAWTLIPAVLGLVQGLNLLGMNQATFDARYNGRSLPPGGYPGNFVVNVSPTIGYGPPAYGPPGYGPPQGAPQLAHQQQQQLMPGPAGGDIAARIGALHDLKIAGALTEDEFIAAKQRLISGNR